MIEDILKAIEQGEVIPNIGQIDAATQRRLDTMAKQGKIGKWRGYWFPVSGAHFGIGPLKTCYGTVAARDYFVEWANRP